MNSKFNEDLSFQFKLATIEQVSNGINNLKSNAQGSDQISALMLKYCSPVISKHVTHIVNCCLELGYFPECWKLSLIKPLPKTKKPATYGDLRPVSILPALSKVLERIIYNQLYEYVVNNGIINSLQSGFRKGHSTTTVLLNIVDDIFRSTDLGKATLLILLDFSKAFDTLDHSLLCAKLYYHGLDEVSLSFFKNYLSGRFQRVFVEGGVSDFVRITSGVPQGSILGPLLFLIYTADIFNCVSHSSVQAFADDTQIIYSFEPAFTEQACVSVNEDLRAIEQYAENNNLKLNAAKCSMLIFCPKKHRLSMEENVQLFINQTRLQPVKTAKNLGLIIDTKVRFSEHVSMVINKCYAVLKPLYTNISIINFKLRKKLCESFILPKINYANIVYFPCLDTLTLIRLQRMINTCCRFVCRLKKFDHISERLTQLKWFKIRRSYEYHLSVFVHRLLQTSSPSYLRHKLKYRLNVHDLDLRYTHRLALPRFHTAKFKNSFSYNAPTIYNEISDDIKRMSLDSFRKKIKHMIFQRSQ